MQSREDTMGSPRKKRLRSLRCRWFNILSSNSSLIYLHGRRLVVVKERGWRQREINRDRGEISTAARLGPARLRRKGSRRGYLEVSTQRGRAS